MYRLSLLLLLAASLASAGTTTIADTVNSIGALTSDTITAMSISYGSFTGTDGTSVTAGSNSPTLTSGNFSVALTPNATTAGVYTATYTGTSGHTYTEHWTVPISQTSLTLSHVRAAGSLLTRNDSTTYILPVYAPTSGSSVGLPSTTALLKGDGSGGAVAATAGTDYVAALVNADATHTGLLTSTDWSTFNGKGSGTVTSVGLSAPSWLSVGSTPVTSTGTLALSAATAQTSHQVIGTCGSATSFAPCALVAADIPTLNQNTTGTAANVTGTVAATNGGTGQTTFTLGDTLYSSASNTLSKLAGNTTSTKQFLTQTGTGTVSAAPAWGAITSGDLPGTISANTSGNAATATALAANPTDCSAGQYATTIAASGNLTCSAVDFSQLATASNTTATLTVGSGGTITTSGTGVNNANQYKGATIPRMINATFDGGGSALSTGKVFYTIVPFACTIAAWNITVDTGTATIKLWKVASGTAIPTSANSINTSGVAISSGTSIHSTTLTDFTTTTVTANDIVAITDTAVSSATMLQVGIQCNE